MVSIAVGMAVAMAVTVGTSVTVAVAVVGIGLSLSLCGPLAPGHGGEGTSGQSVGVVVAVVAGIDVVVVDSNAVAVVGIGISAPLAEVVSVVSDNTVETLGRPGNKGGGDTGVGSNASKSVAVERLSAPLSVGMVGAGTVDGGLTAVTDSSGPGSGDAAGSNDGVAVGSV